MIKSKNFKSIILSTLLLTLLISCGSLQTGIKQVHLDMTRQEVISKVGNDFDVVSMVKTDQGNLEIIRYTILRIENDKTVPAEYYFFHFLDGKLVEMNQEEAGMPIIVQPPHRHH